jgi:PA14 domain-containing protein
VSAPSVGRLAGAVARGALAAVCFLLVLAVLRWPPVEGASPGVRALHLYGPAVGLAVVAALAGRARRPARVKPLLAALGACLLALAALTLARPPAGLPATVSDPRGVVGRLPPGPVEVSGPRLRHLPAVRKWTFQWDGPLRAPVTGRYRFWATGRGRVEVLLDGRPLLEAEGEALEAGADLALHSGDHRLAVTLTRTGPGPRLRLGWTLPDGRSEAIPSRWLGPRRPLWWALTDVLAVAVAALAAALVWRVPWDRPRAWAPPPPVTRAELGFSGAGHLALVLLMSWPLARGLATYGVTDRPDGRLSAWILAWDGHALLHQPSRVFQAPAFHPLPDALTFSESLLLPGLLAAPANAFGGPVLGYNLVLLASLVASGLGAQLLVRRVSGDRLAAFVGGALFAVGSHRWIRLAHIHAELTVFLPLALLALDRFWEKRTWRPALLAGVFLALQALCSVYVGAITALAFAVAVGVMAVGGLRGRDVLKLGAGLALAAVLLAPTARPYLRMRALQGMEWTLADVGTYATTLESYAASGTRLYGGLTQRHLDPGQVQDTLFPGLVPLVLGVMGLASAPRRYRAVFLLAAAAAVVVSLGPRTELYRFLHEHVVLVRSVRALSRFSLLPVLGLCVLSGLALAGRPRLAALALVLGLAEASQVPLGYDRYQGPPEVARWLAGRPGAVAYVPLGVDDTRVMLDGVAHFRPLVNGDSGFVPRPYARAQELLEAAPLTDEARRFLRAVGVRHVVSRAEEALPEVARFGADRVYELDAAEPGAAFADASRPEPCPTAWGADGILLDLGQPRVVEGVAFEVSDAPWLALPRVAASMDGRAWTDVAATASLADATLALYRDPRHGEGSVRFAPVTARFVRLDPGLPARDVPLRPLRSPSASSAVKTP